MPSKQIITKSKADWSNATNIDGYDRSSHDSGISYNWANITHTGGVYSNSVT